MSAEGDDDGPGRREVARRVFAAEYDDADFSYSESDEERAPNYVVVPTGARVNRLFLVGVLTETETVGDGVLRGRIVDPTGAFVVYAGQYQPEAAAALDGTDPPAFLAVAGKARTFQPEDSEQVYTSVRPESINEVDADTRDRWVVRTAEHTIARVAALAGALDRPERGDDLRAALDEEGIDEALTAGIPLAIERYGTTRSYLGGVYDLALDAARVVAGEREEVDPLDVAPGEGGDATVDVGDDLPAGAATLLGDAPAATSTEAPAATDTAGTTDAGEPAGPTGTTEAAETTESTDATGGEAATDPSGVTDADDETGTAGTAETAEGASEQADPAETAEPPPTDTAGAAGADEAATDEMYELDEEEREEIESEYGTEFTTGEEIPDAGETDIETPDPEESAGETTTGDADDEEETAAEPEADGDDEPPSGEDLEDVVVEEMRALDDGGGVDRGTLVESVVGESGADETAVEDAIQEALMNGRCYESGDDELTPI